ncbi:MAG: DUF1549 domain-containing protein, partial [Planctomycetales bacterium]|nr:DUF1549 domain-containing protein [Planctomycetales bacterium]
MTGFFSAWWGSAVTVFVCVITWAMAGTEGLAAPDATKSIPDPATQPQLAKIEELLRRSWSDYGLSPASRATDGEWCRRVYLDLLGRVPTVDELQAFTTLRERDKDAQLVERLLTDSLYTEEYARNFTTLWTNILIGRNGGNEDRSLTNRAGLQKYLRDSFARNKPYDQLARELITATGASQPGRDGFNGAVNFLAMKLADDAMLATADTARIFLGLQVQCTQCHNHPFNEWKQNQYWELNAFFRQTRSLRRFEAGTNEVAYIELADQDFGGEGTTPQDAEIYYELRNGQVKAAYPVFVDGTKISTSGYLADVRRRGELGRLVTDSEYLSRAIVNRMWGQFLGYGFTKPVDDMGPHNAPSHPELLDYLASEFRAANYDLKTLIRWITLNPAYRLSSRTTKSNASDDPLMGEPPKFSHFYLRQLRAEELYESLLVAT